MLEGRVFPLVEGMVIGREQERVHVHLPHPQVSRVHARVDLEGRTAILTDLNSANGTFVNGFRIQTSTSLQAGDQIDIGPYALQFTGQALIPRPRSDNVELVARGIQRIVRAGNAQPETAQAGAVPLQMKLARHVPRGRLGHAHIRRRRFAISDGAAVEGRQEALHVLIVQANDGRPVEGNLVDKLAE